MTTPVLPLTFWYKNHRGEEGLRTVFPISIRFGTTKWHPEAQWLLRAFDRDKQSEREFAMRDLVAAPPVRGDREKIAQVVAETIFNDDLKNLDGNKQDACRHVADAILPAQPGAGERGERIAKASALARKLCQLFDSGGESQRTVRARHASAIFQLLGSDEAEQKQCDADPVCYLERCERIALSRQPPHSSDGEGR